jgi:hypothetical protein
LAAFSRISSAKAARRSLRGIDCLKRRRLGMARSFPLPEEGGSANRAFSSQIKATIRSVMVESLTELESPEITHVNL